MYIDYTLMKVRCVNLANVPGRSSMYVATYIWLCNCIPTI